MPQLQKITLFSFFHHFIQFFFDKFNAFQPNSGPSSGKILKKEQFLDLFFKKYNIFPLGTEQGWSEWHLLIVDSIRGGKGGSS